MLETLFSSRVRAKLLTAFFLSPGIERNAWELAHSLNENYSAVWKELVRLDKLGILKSSRTAHAKNYLIDPSCPIIPELRSIVLKTEGIGRVIHEQFQELGGIREAFIYGSYASGEADEKSDIDLMIIGEVNLERLAAQIAELEKKLNRPINYLIYPEVEWSNKLSSGEPFALNVQQAPKVMLVG